MNAVIIGANRGIGLGLVNRYLERGWKVWGVCRSQSKELEALGAHENLRIIAGIDVTKEEDRILLEKQLPNDIQDLIHNAGILRSDSLATLSEKDIMEQFVVNALSPLQTIQKVHSKVKVGGKIGIISSRMGSIADNTSGGMYGYRMSKAAVNMAGMGLAQELRGSEIGVFLLHPGFVQTDMTGGRGYISVETSSTGLYQKMQELSLTETGTFWHTDGSQLVW